MMAVEALDKFHFVPDRHPEFAGVEREIVRVPADSIDPSHDPGCIDRFHVRDEQFSSVDEGRIPKHPKVVPEKPELNI
jgi:hypothetical protein